MYELHSYLRMRLALPVRGGRHSTLLITVPARTRFPRSRLRRLSNHRKTRWGTPHLFCASVHFRRLVPDTVCAHLGEITGPSGTNETTQRPPRHREHREARRTLGSSIWTRTSAAANPGTLEKEVGCPFIRKDRDWKCAW